MWAIRPEGVGKKVGARAIKPGWPLASGETFVVGEYHPGLVLAEDEKSLRPPTPQEELSSPEKTIVDLIVEDKNMLTKLKAALKTA